jgi:hypothetical protein
VAEVLAARDAFVDQFVHALPDGPVAFDYPAPALATDLEIAPRQTLPRRGHEPAQHRLLR